MKRCYSLTTLGAYATPWGAAGTRYRINSKIWLRAQGTIRPDELQVYGNFIVGEIRRVWGTTTNPGLSRGDGDFVYNSTNDWITCIPIDGGVSNNTGTGVEFGDWATRVGDPNVLNIGEMRVDLRRRPNPGERAFMDERSQTGQLFYFLFTAAPAPAYMDNFNVHLTAAHEFGHALGLSDRYHFMANGKGINESASSDKNFICVSGGGDVPMYLPGLFDPKINYDTGGFSGSDPRYLQVPYNALPYTASSPLFINTGATPQPNYDSPNGPDSPGVYDIEYNTGFAWLHNLFSTKNPISGAFANAHPFRSGTSGPSSALYRQIYLADYNNLQEIIQITKIQLDVVLDQELTEKEQCEMRGFSKRIFDQFIFIMHAKFRNVTCGNQPNDPDYLIRPLIRNGAASTFFGTPAESYGTFVGISYQNKKGLDKNGEGGLVVSDIQFQDEKAELKSGTTGLPGIHDVMSYRMSDYNSAGDANEWSPRTVMYPNSSDFLVGFFNPELTPERGEKEENIDHIIRNAADKYFRIRRTTTINNPDEIVAYGNALPQYFFNRLNFLILSGGTPSQVFTDPVLKQLVNSTDTVLNSETADLFSEVGIGNWVGRKIWNGISNVGCPIGNSVGVAGNVWDWNYGRNKGLKLALIEVSNTALPPGSPVLSEYYLNTPHFINRRIMRILSTPE